MWQFIKKIFRDCFTEGDGESYCLVRISFGLLIMSFIGNAIYSIYLSHTLDLIGFGTGASALLGGGGIGIGSKSKLGADAPIEQEGPNQ